MTEASDIENALQPEQQTTREPTSFRLIITLAVAGLLAGILISGVNLYTQPMIRANKALALQKAIFQVLPGCADYRTLVFEDGSLVEIEISEDGTDQEMPQTMFAGYDSVGTFIGVAIVAGEPGFQDVITGIFGYDPQSKIIVGFEVLESKETPGLGDKIIKDQRFRENFTALATEPEVSGVKFGEKKNANEVEMITGATISSKTVVRLLNKGLEETTAAMQEFAAKKLIN